MVRAAVGRCNGGDANEVAGGETLIRGGSASGVVRSSTVGGRAAVGIGAVEVGDSPGGRGGETAASSGVSGPAMRTDGRHHTPATGGTGARGGGSGADIHRGRRVCMRAAQVVRSILAWD